MLGMHYWCLANDYIYQLPRPLPYDLLQEFLSLLVGINANTRRMGQAHFPIKTCSFALYSWDIQMPFLPLSVNLWPDLILLVDNSLNMDTTHKWLVKMLTRWFRTADLLIQWMYVRVVTLLWIQSSHRFISTFGSHPTDNSSRIFIFHFPSLISLDRFTGSHKIFSLFLSLPLLHNIYFFTFTLAI